MTAARHAVEQAGADAPRGADATAQLKLAEDAFRAARYDDAARKADAAWQLVSKDARQNTRFTVDVADDGKTTVSARSGQPVRVEAQGISQPVYAGQTATVEKGQGPAVQPPGAPTDLSSTLEQPPKATPTPLTAPVLLSPKDAVLLTLKPGPQGMGPVKLSWKAVPAASSYQVEVTADAGGAPQILRATGAEVRLAALPAGKYHWSVKALGAAGQAAESARRWFELKPAPLKLQVKQPTFQ